jgi:hypothetical protein
MLRVRDARLGVFDAVAWIWRNEYLFLAIRRLSRRGGFAIISAVETFLTNKQREKEWRLL